MTRSQYRFEEDSSLWFARANAFLTPVSRGCLPYYPVKAERIVLIDERPPHDSPIGAGESR